ncbi:MAG: hypothetical protein JRJ49_03830 [Deltaproteobacteria bacterium]|nr:hypothetical protein [Deltaproteobacteria bacterium]
MKQNISNKNNIVKIIEKLAAKREKILALTPEDALKEIINDNEALPLIHSFAEDDLRLLIWEIGIADALPLIAMASSKQITYILDAESWNKDRFDINAALNWFFALKEADPKRLLKWFLQEEPEEKKDLLNFILNRLISVGVREKNQEPSDFDDDFFTFDDLFYIKIKSFADSEIKKEKIEELIKSFLQDMAKYNYPLFQKILFAASAIIPAETEEDLFRMKNIRLAEKGFVPYYEAVSIYQPLNRQTLKKKGKKIFFKKIAIKTTDMPAVFLKHTDQKDLFARAVRLIKNPDIITGIYYEFTSLCNHIISADKKIIKSKPELDKSVKKAAGYLSMALETFYNKEKPSQKNKEKFCADIISKYMLADIFRYGYKPVAALKKKAKQFVEKSFFKKNGFSLSFLDEKLAGICGGVLLDKPLFFDNYKNGNLYKDFASQKEIEYTDKELNKAIAADMLLKKLNIKTDKIKDKTLTSFISYKNLLLTFWVEKINLPLPLTKEELIKFFNAIFEKKDNKKNRIKESAKKDFLSQVVFKNFKDQKNISAQLSAVLKELFDELEEEYKYIEDFKFLDTRYVKLFLTEAL